MSRRDSVKYLSNPAFSNTTNTNPPIPPEGSFPPLMTDRTIVTDPFLRSVLDAVDQARAQSLAILDFLDRHPSSPDHPFNRELELQLSEQQKQLNALLAHLRGLNRQAIHGVRKTKQQTADARQEIDTLHLQLQNLYYEQRHLEGEIAACESYDHKYQQLPLIPVEEFLERFPEHKDDDENALMVARIEHEHAERQALEERRQGLLKKKQGLIAENKKRKEDLANLDKDLEKFIDASKPIMKTFEKEY